MQLDGISVIQRWAGDSERWLAGFLQEASSNRSIVTVVVMGSAVRARGHRRSDLDLLLIYRGKRPVIKAPLEVDIRFLAMERADEQIARGHEVLCWALKFGTALYDPEGYWEQLQEAWSESVPLPSVTEARDRAGQDLARAIEMLEAGDESAADDLVLAALTQFARERLIRHGVFPASRPELPDQLRVIDQHDPLARMLDEAMYGDAGPSDLIDQLRSLSGRKGSE